MTVIAAESSTNQVRYATIKGFPGYRVGTDGSVWTSKRNGRFRVPPARNWRPLAPSRHPAGYLYIHLSHEGKVRSFKAHRLVLEAFVGPCPDGMEALHGNGIKSDNRLSNLRWGTREENHEDRRKHGVLRQGRQISTAKLTPELVLEVRRRRDAGEQSHVIARDIGVSTTAVWFAGARKSWKHV